MNLITETFCLTHPRWDEECDVTVDCRKNGMYRMIFQFDTGEWAQYWCKDPQTHLRELQKAFNKHWHWKEPIRFNLIMEV